MLPQCGRALALSNPATDIIWTWGVRREVTAGTTCPPVFITPPQSSITAALLFMSCCRALSKLLEPEDTLLCLRRPHHSSAESSANSAHIVHLENVYCSVKPEAVQYQHIISTCLYTGEHFSEANSGSVPCSKVQQPNLEIKHKIFCLQVKIFNQNLHTFSP